MAVHAGASGDRADRGRVRASWRLPAVFAALMSKGALLVIWAPCPTAAVPWRRALLLLLIVAAAVFVHEAWQEARWNGMLPLRMEV